jgi:hypothetical protein
MHKTKFDKRVKDPMKQYRRNEKRAYQNQAIKRFVHVNLEKMGVFGNKFVRYTSVIDMKKNVIMNI